MRNFKKALLIIPAIISTVTLSSCTVIIDKVLDIFFPITNTSTSGGSNNNGVIVPADAGNYYKDYNLGYTGAKLQSELHHLMIDTHKTYCLYSKYTTYTKANTSPRSIDEDPDNSSNNRLFYTGKSVSKSSSYTREHVWPCANSANLWPHEDGTSDVATGGGSDLFHVRPCNSTVNTKRGNAKYMDLTGASDVVEGGETNGKYTLKYQGLNSDGQYANRVEPADEYKGDIVRILMYVWIHYGKFGTYNNQYCGSLDLSNVMGYSNKSELYEVMVKWNKLDPVDEHEKLRNNTVQAIQGNRNPFVDCPSLMAACFDIDE